MENKAAQEKALEMVKAVHDDGIATINGTDYELTKLTHKVRRKIWAFYSSHAPTIQAGNFGFMDSSEWDSIETLLNDITLVDGVQISKRANYWDEHAGDYLQFVATILPVICYPFLKGGLSN